MRNEDRLILGCARRAPVGGLVSQNVNWERFLGMARVHGLSALAYVHLKGVEGVPEKVLAELRGRARASAMQGLKLTVELIRVMDAFRASGIEALPFKGPVLAALLYGDAPLREFSDLDILVRRRDFERAMEALGRLGYHNPPAGNGGLWFEAGNSERVMVRKATGTVVDLHWGLTKQRFVRGAMWADVWERLETVAIGAREMPSLAAEDLLHYLCVHGSKHLWASLGWICDVAEVVHARPEMDWDVLTERARLSGTRRMLLLGLLLAHELLGASVPAGVLESARSDTAVRRLAAEVREGMFEEEGQRSGPFRIAAFMLRASERWRERARQVFMIAASPSCVLHGVRWLANGGGRG